MKGKWFAFLSLLMAFGLMVTACAPAATQAPPTEAMAQPTEAMAATSMPAPTEAPAPTAMPTEVWNPTIDCAGVTAGDTLTLMYQWSGSEQESINKVLQPFVSACGVALSSESTRDPAVLDTRVKSTPPDVLFWPSTAPIGLYGDKLQDLTALGADTSNYPSYWIDGGTANGKLVALPAKADPKTMIWYSPAQFETFGYTVPTTFDELNTLVEKMVADGNVPWSMGNNNGGAFDGWAGTDFIQDTLLVTQGPDYVMSIISGGTPYDDQAVQDAYAQYYKWASDPKYAVGGATGTVNTPFLDSIYKVFSDPPEAMMVKISGFAGGAIQTQYPDLQYGTDYDFFPFPGAQGMQGGADYMFAFSDSPATQALVKYLTSTDGGRVWASTGFDVSPNAGAAGHYPDQQLEKKYQMLANAKGFTPDMGDTIPAPFGETECKAIVDVIQGADIPTELAAVAAVQKEALKK